MNLHRREILQSQDLEKTIEEDREIHKFDLDELYENKIKILYSAIIDFISRSQPNMSSVFSEELFRLRNAATEIVECVKHIKYLRKNATKYMLSDNEYIRKEYNRLRYQIAMILKEIYRLREEEDYDSEGSRHTARKVKTSIFWWQSGFNPFFPPEGSNGTGC